MRKITNLIIAAFEGNIPLRSGNDKVVVNGETTELYLHDNLIASKTKGVLSVSNAGWFTNTTKERLNGLSGVSVNQKKGVWYLNGIEWDGKMKVVKP